MLPMGMAEKLLYFTKWALGVLPDSHKWAYEPLGEFRKCVVCNCRQELDPGAGHAGPIWDDVSPGSGACEATAA